MLKRLEALLDLLLHIYCKCYVFLEAYKFCAIWMQIFQFLFRKILAFVLHFKLFPLNILNFADGIWRKFLDESETNFYLCAAQGRKGISVLVAGKWWQAGRPHTKLPSIMAEQIANTKRKTKGDGVLTHTHTHTHVGIYVAELGHKQWNLLLTFMSSFPQTPRKVWRKGWKIE